MLSIGITVCDKDYKKCGSLLKQIEQKVKVDHEVIIIDNREKFAAEKTEWKAAFSFGYNAYQFAARAKIIALARGEYIWFVDGDDEIKEIKSFDYTQDIVAFSFETYPNGVVHLTPGTYDQDLFSYEMSVTVSPVLWNKFIKKSLFYSDFIEKYGNLKMVTNEDVLWVYEALKHAGSVLAVDQVIYVHNEGFSNKQEKVMLEDLEHLTTGFPDMLRVLREVIDDDNFYDESVNRVCRYLMDYAAAVDDFEGVAALFWELFPKMQFLKFIGITIWRKLKGKRSYRKNSANYIYYPYENIKRTRT